MNKLKLQLDELRVESFETGEDGTRGGTVMGLQVRTIPIKDPSDTTCTDEPFTYGAGSCNGGVCTDEYSCQESWANGCTSDPMTGWTDPGYC